MRLLILLFFIFSFLDAKGLYNIAKKTNFLHIQLKSKNYSSMQIQKIIKNKFLVDELVKYDKVSSNFILDTELLPEKIGENKLKGLKRNTIKRSR